MGERLYVGMGQLQNGRVVPDGANRLTVTKETARKYGLQLGDVLFNRTNSLELVGKTAIVSDSALIGSVFASYLVRLKVDRERYNPRFLNIWMNMRDNVARLRRLATPGVAQYNIRPSLLAEKFLVPAWPLEQQRYVADIDELFENYCNLCARLVSAKKAMKHALVQRLLTGRKRFQAFDGGAWNVLALGDVVTYTPRNTAKPQGHFLSAGVRSHGKGVFLKREFPASGIALDELFALRSGDLVVNITFGWEGAVAIVPPEADGALVSHRFPTYVVDESKVLVDYLRHLIRTKRFIFDVGVASPGGAGRNRVLNRQEFLRIQIRLPGIDEQRRIAEILNELDRDIDLSERLYRQVARQRSAVASRLLSGDVVPKAL